VDIETVTITATTLPAWLTLTDNGDGTATLTGTPLNANVGNNNVVLNVSDGSVSSNQSFTIAVANTNDAATVSSANIALSETDAALTTSGTLTSIDIDNPDNTFTVQTIVGTIGTLNIDAAGVWDFTANSAFDNLSVGQNVNKTFSVTSVDGTTSSVKITINGTNDTPVVSGISAGSVQEDVTVVSTNINTTGLLTITDVDTGEASFQAGSIAGAYGNLTIDATGSWIYTADNNQTAIQQLDQGESLTDTLTVSTYDGTPHTIVITLNGTEDAATISGTTTGTVTEDSLLTSSGPLTITDTDTSDPTDFVDLAATASDNGYGSFEIRANTWTYTLDNTNTSVQALDATETLSDSYTFTAPDGVTQQVTVTINGAEDTPVVAATQLFSVSELATNGFSLGNAIGTDIDTRSTLQDWSISNGNEDGIFAINAATGEITVSDNSKLDFESTVSYTLSLTVTDGNNTSAVENVTVNVTNAATVITTGQAYTISETAANNAIVGRVGTTGDSPVTYRIKAGNTGSVFAIDNTGQITVADALALDYETLTQYTLTIEVSDGTTTNKQEVIVRVTDVNDTIVENLTDDPGFTTPDPADEINTDYQSTENAPSENNTTTPNDFEITDEYVANTRSTADPTSLLSESGSEINSETNDANIDATQKEHSDDSNYVKPGSGFDQWIESQLHTLNEIDLQLDETHDLFEVSEFDGNEELWKNIDLMRDQMDADKKLLDRQDVEIEFVAGATISFTAGFVSWVLRGGALLSSLLSSVSIFKQFDPMAVVFKKSNKNDKNQVNDDEQDEVEAMFDNENKK
jgi:VCBS repeat-containing protein